MESNRNEINRVYIYLEFMGVLESATKLKFCCVFFMGINTCFSKMDVKREILLELMNQTGSVF
jgi:hypothetical protein